LRIVNYVTRLVYQGFNINDPYLKNIVEKTHIVKADDGQAVRDKLGSYVDSLNYYAVRSISKMAHEDKTNLIAVYLPSVREKGTRRDSIFLANICTQYDMNLISLTDVFLGHDVTELSLSDIDFHPNKKANGLIADSLLDNIIRHQDYFKIQFTKK
jgi:hypothetical protein